MFLVFEYFKLFLLIRPKKMIKKSLIILSVFIFCFQTLNYAHPWKPDHFVIIDTDGGFDDFRAINMLLASSSVRVLAVISSNGVLNAHEAYQKLKGLMADSYHQGILLGMNNRPTCFVNNCIPAKDFKWGSTREQLKEIPNHLDIIREVLKNSSENITFLNFGNLSTYYSAINEIPGLSKRLKNSLWACSLQNFTGSFNYKSDSVAYQMLIQQKIPINRIDGNVPQFTYNQLIENLAALKNGYATNILRSLHESKSSFANTFYDENLVLYLHKPDYFIADSAVSNPIDYRMNKIIKPEEIGSLILDILDGKTVNQNQVFSKFPMDTTYYTDEIQAIMPYCLERYGRNEWIATVMANEMHRHLGIYAVIGTKMGMRARGYFGAGIDELLVISHAGINPPYSCMNDGLQISTGATLGHGLIKIKADTLKLPKAEFSYMNRKISIQLKEEYRKRVESEIKNLVMVYGLDSNLYWDLVRKLAIDYWKYWDRHEIFTLTEEE